MGNVYTEWTPEQYANQNQIMEDNFGKFYYDHWDRATPNSQKVGMEMGLYNSLPVSVNTLATIDEGSLTDPFETMRKDTL